MSKKLRYRVPLMSTIFKKPICLSCSLNEILYSYNVLLVTKAT